MRLLLDEMYPPRIALQLRKRGHDVVAVAERPELRTMDDEILLGAATADARVLVTENLIDFVEIANLYTAERRDHTGVILVSSKTFPRTEHGIGVLIRALDSFLSAHLRDRALAAGVHWLTPHG